MNKLYGIMVTEWTIYSKQLGKDYNVAIRLPGFGDALFFPLQGMDHNSDVIILHGVLEGGEETRVILDKNPFPLAFVAVRRNEDEPKREFGFGQPSSNEG